MPIDVRNEDCPKDWFRVPLSATAQDGKENFIDGDWIEAPYITDRGIRLLQTGNIGIGVLLDKPDTRKYISPKSFNNLRCKWVHPGDILICRLAEPIGRACKVPDYLGDCITAVDVTIFRPHPDRLHSNYAIHLLNSERHLKRLEDVAGGSTRQRISRGNLGQTKICIPSLSEQCRIAEILDTLDDAIQKTEQLIAKLKQIKQGLLQDLLTQGIDENGQLRNPIAYPEQFKDSVLGRIPTAWEAVRIKDVGKVFGGKRLPAGHAYSEEPTGYTYLRVLDFFEKAIAPKTLMSLPPKTFAALERYEIHDGNLYISIAGSIGHVGVFAATENTRTVLTENAARIELAEDMHPPFVAYQMNGHEVQRQIDIEKGTGGGVPKLALFRIENLRIAQPPEAEQKAISQRMLVHEKAIALEEENLHKLMAIKKGLMHDLLTGKVRVNTKEGNDK
ncbi:MAG: restriction endonuclease subunit S [Candidatus Thiodiazotropha sp.]